MKPKVAILLSTYNGEKYLESQVQTILNQSEVDISLFVRDDGSNDGTITILERLSVDPRVYVYLANNVGWRRSFMSLIFDVDDSFDFFAFADQDDEWESDKIIRAIKQLRLNDGVVYFSNLKLYDGDMNYVGMEFANDYRPVTQFKKAYFEGVGTGATIVFDRSMLAKIREYRPDELLSHDAYVIALGRLLFPEKVVYDVESRIRYRRHANNATGFEGKFRPGHISLLQRYKRYKKNNSKPFSRRAKALLDGYSSQMDPKNLRYLKSVANSNENLISRLNVILSPEYRTRGLRKTLQIKFRAFVKTL